MLTFGAHSIKNGLAPVFIKLIEDGWVTHLATNGAGIIHDWEFAFQGHSSEDVRTNVDRGEFGVWQETGFYLNLAIVVGAYEGLGYGESVGALVQNEGLKIPSLDALTTEIQKAADQDYAEHAAAACDLINVIKKFDIAPGFMSVKSSVSTCWARTVLPAMVHAVKRVAPASSERREMELVMEESP